MANLFTEKLELCVSDQINNKGLDKIDARELGETVDMIKDGYEIEMLKSKKKYYDSIVEAMGESEYGSDYDYRGMTQRGYRQPVMYDDDWMESRMGYGSMGYSSRGGGSRGRGNNQGNYGSSNSSRYGFSHDEYMEKRNMYPNDEAKRKELLNTYLDDMYEMAKDMVADMSPEEKQIWKAKLSRVVNM